MEPLKRAARKVSDRLRPYRPRAETGELRHALEPENLQRGHTLGLLVDGDEAFPAMLHAIAAAEKQIWLETYIFESDVTGRVFVEALAERARSGVQVLLLVDAFGGLGFHASEEAKLLAAGAELRFFGRFNHMNLGRWIQRNHRKLLLVDHDLAFVGGFNISDDYASIRAGGKGWHDILVRIEGPIHARLARVFAETWERAGGAALPLIPRLTQALEGEWAMALYSNHKGVRMRIRSHILHAIRNAETEVLLASPYFIPDRGVQRQLQAAVARGIPVRVLVPSRSDVQSVQWAGEHVYERLLASGVQIYAWPGTHMHAKAAVVDRRWCLFGSYNLDFFSLMHNLELVVETVGDYTPAALADQLYLDFANSTEIQVDSWRRRPALDKLLSNIAYRFRRWL